MPLNPNKDLKLFYSISEVAKMFGVSETLLRFWEKEFPFITPQKASRGVRQYKKENIDNIRLVYHLVKEKGMTLQGAREAIKHGATNDNQRTEVIDRLKKVREELQALNRSLNILATD